MDLLQTFSPDKNLTILSEKNSSEAGSKVAKRLIFNGNLIDLTMDISDPENDNEILIHTSPR